MIYGSNIFLKKKKKRLNYGQLLMTIVSDIHQNYLCYSWSHDNIKLTAEWIFSKRHGPDHFSSHTAVCFCCFPWAGTSIHVANSNQIRTLIWLNSTPTEIITIIKKCLVLVFSQINYFNELAALPCKCKSCHNSEGAAVGEKERLMETSEFLEEKSCR